MKNENVRRDGIRRAWIMSAIFFSLFLILSIFVVGMTIPSIQEWDRQIIQEVVRWRGAELSDLFFTLTYLGSVASVSIIGVISFIFLWMRGERSFAILLFFSGLGSATGVRFFKYIGQRPRPPSGDWLIQVSNTSFPSGHATESAAILGALFYILGRFSNTTSQRRFFEYTGAILVTSIAFSRVYLGVHYPSDVVAGLLLGYSALYSGIAFSRLCALKKDIISLP